MKPKAKPIEPKPKAAPEPDRIICFWCRTRSQMVGKDLPAGWRYVERQDELHPGEQARYFCCGGEKCGQ